MKGVYRREGHQIPVAVKTLKHDDLPNAEVRHLPHELPAHLPPELLS